MLVRVKNSLLLIPLGSFNDYVQTLEGISLWPAAFLIHPAVDFHNRVMSLYTKGLLVFGTQWNFFLAMRSSFCGPTRSLTQSLDSKKKID